MIYIIYLSCFHFNIILNSFAGVNDINSSSRKDNEDKKLVEPLLVADTTSTTTTSSTTATTITTPPSINSNNSNSITRRHFIKSLTGLCNLTNHQAVELILEILNVCILRLRKMRQILCKEKHFTCLSRGST